MVCPLAFIFTTKLMRFLMSMTKINVDIHLISTSLASCDDPSIWNFVIFVKIKNNIFILTNTISFITNPVGIPLWESSQDGLRRAH